MKSSSPCLFPPCPMSVPLLFLCSLSVPCLFLSQSCYYYHFVVDIRCLFPHARMYVCTCVSARSYRSKRLDIFKLVNVVGLFLRYGIPYFTPRLGYPRLILVRRATGSRRRGEASKGGTLRKGQDRGLTPKCQYPRLVS